MMCWYNSRLRWHHEDLWFSIAMTVRTASTMVVVSIALVTSMPAAATAAAMAVAITMATMVATVVIIMSVAVPTVGTRGHIDNIGR